MSDNKTQQKWFDITDTAINNIRKDNDKYSIELLGKELIVFPNVFSPKYFSDALFFAKVIPSLVK